MTSLIQAFFAWLEATDFSTWLRESLSPLAFPTVLTLHTVSMGFVAGLSAAVDLRILGVAASVPLREMKRFFPVVWLSFWVSVVTGINLVIAYPTKAMTNPVFWVKLLLIALSLLVSRLVVRHVLTEPPGEQRATPANARALAAISLACWLLVIVAGRMLPYTYSHLLSGEGEP